MNAITIGIFSVLILSMINGCASSAKNVGTAYISPTRYKNYTCDELVDENAYLSGEIQRLAQSLNKEATKDTAQTTGAFLLMPFTFGLSLGILGALEGGDGPEAVQYSRLKGEYQAIRDAAKRKKCQF